MDLIHRIFLALLMPSFLQFCYCQNSLELVPGDVMLGAMFSVNTIQNGQCGDYDIDALKELMAVKWFLDTLNDISYIPGIRLGLEVYRTCQNAEQTVRNVVQMMEKFHVLSDNVQDINSTTPLLGLVGPGRTEEAIAVSRFLSSLPPEQRLLIISGSATGATLADRNLYSNFYRVIPPDSTQVQVLSKLLQQLGWNYIAIVYDDDDYGRQAAEELRGLATNVCVPVFKSLPLDYRSQDFITAADSIIDRIRGGDSSIITGIVFIGTVPTAKEFITRLSQRATFVRFIFSEGVGVGTSVVAGTSVGKGALAAAPPYLPLPEFQVFWNSLWTNRTVFLREMQQNSWLEGYYKAVTSCEISNINCWQLNQNNLPLIHDNTQWLFEYYQVKATAVYASVLKRLHTSKCGHASNSVCLPLKQLIRNDREQIVKTLMSGGFNLQEEFLNVSSIFIGQTDVGFSNEGEITAGEHNNSLYNVFNYRECSNNAFCFQEVGTYSVDGMLQLDTVTIKGYNGNGDTLSWPQFPKSQCMVGHDCSECLSSDIPGDIVFVPGDFYVVAVAPVNNRATNSPLQCGAIRQTDGAELVQSVLFAVQQVNKKRAPFTGIFGTKTLGVLILNSCFRELVITEKLIDLHKGTLILPDGRNSSAILPYIAGYVGAFFSTISVAMYEVLSNLDTRFVIVSPCNTSPELSDREKYPLYLRLTSGQDTQARALLTLVQDLGQQYVQVIYDPDDSYTSALTASINTLVASNAYNVCVVNTIPSTYGGQRYYSILDKLRKNVWAPLIIVVLQTPHTELLMADILPLMTSSDKFRFLGTDSWARAESVLSVPNKERLLGSLTFSVELPLNQLFNEYLREMDPLNTQNLWLKYFWEARKQCYFDGSFQKEGKTGLCPQNIASDYVQSSWVPFYIDAIYTFALGLNTAMTQRCGQAYLCEALTSQNLVSALRGVRLDLFNNGGKVNVFDNNSDGDIGYRLLQISFNLATSAGDDMTYEQVGRYEHGSLILDRSSLWLLQNLETAQCPNPNACDACFPTVPTGPVVDANNNSSNEGALIATGIIIALLAIAVIVLVIFFILAVRRLRAQKQTDRQKVALDSLPVSSAPEPRPLPPVNHRTSSTRSGENSTSSGLRNSGITPNDYDYLHHYHSDNTATQNRHSYLQPVHSAGSVQVSSSTPPSISHYSSGYVTRDSDGDLPLDLSGSSSGGRKNSQAEGDSSESGGSVFRPPIVFENEVPLEEAPALPKPCHSSSGSDYMTPVSDYLTPSEA